MQPLRRFDAVAGLGLKRAHFGGWLRTKSSPILVEDLKSRHEDLKAIEAAAKASKQTVSEWVRSTIHASLEA